MPDKPKAPLVSIILPTYNRARYIGETIESIREQEYQHWELIIIDDGSDDNTEEIVIQMADPRISYFYAGRIGINGRIKNIGLQKATGDFIAFIDSDDLWAPSKLAKQVAALEQYADAGFSLTGGFNFREKGVPVDHFYQQQNGLKYGTIFLSLFQSEIAAFTQALMIRKSCFMKTGGFKEAKSFSDVDFILELAYHFRAVILYEPLVYRRLHQSNYIHAHWIKSCQEGIELVESYKKEKRIPLQIARDALFRIHVNFGEKYLDYNHPITAIRQFMKAWSYRPLSGIPLKKTGKALLHHFINGPSANKAVIFLAVSSIGKTFLLW